jgi:hypothetical protein
LCPNNTPFLRQYKKNYIGLNYIRKYNASNDQKIKVTKCKLKPNQYRLEEDKQFDLDEELESMKPSRHLRPTTNHAAGAAGQE